MSIELIQIEVAYATVTEQVILNVDVPAGSTVQQAIILSGILQRFPQIDLAHQGVGIFGNKVELTDGVQQGDRIEIYRILLIDPKEARRRRAQLAKNKT